MGILNLLFGKHDNVAPNLVAIAPDDRHAQCVGRMPDGRQFFLTTPFVRATSRTGGREFIALYLFDPLGNLLEARIHDLGTRMEFDKAQARRIFQQRRNELGKVEHGRIEVRPFEVERFGLTFGLVCRPPDEEEGWRVVAEPGGYMTFRRPWRSGKYQG
jgi:hypothetical protein